MLFFPFIQAFFVMLNKLIHFVFRKLLNEFELFAYGHFPDFFQGTVIKLLAQGAGSDNAKKPDFFFR